MIEEKRLSPHSLNELEFAEDDEQTMAPNIPLPDEEPKSPDLSHLPQEVLRSGTVESLISQNEDLMARLKVNLRRMSLLEQEVDRSRSENHQLQSTLRAVKDQLLVFKEKDQRRFEDSREINEQLQELKKQLARTEQSYTELFENSASRDKSQKEQINHLQYSLKRFLRYRARIHTFIKPRLKSTADARRNYQKAITELEQNLERKNHLVDGLREQINKISRNASLQADSFEELKLQLVESHERELQRVNEELSQLKNFEIEALRSREKLGNLQENMVEIQNELVRTQRSKQSLGEKLSEQIRELQGQVQSLKRSTSEIEFHRNELSEENQSLSQQSQSLQKDLDMTREQLEQARLMWEKKNQELEKVKSSNQSLEKINFELSTTAKSHREIIQKALTELDVFLKNAQSDSQFDREAQKENLSQLEQHLRELNSN